MTTPLQFSEILTVSRPDETAVAWQADGTFLTLGELRRHAATLAAQLARHPARHWALCCDNATALATAFLAALHTGKHIVLPGHTRAALLEEQHRAGHFDALLTDLPLTLDCPVLEVRIKNEERKTVSSSDRLEACATSPFTASPPPTPSQIAFFTSGSTGQPKRVVKTLAQLQIENDLHAAHWGRHLPGALVLGTTAHHHLYGLQFRVLLPLTLGCPFNAALIEYHEQLLAAPQPFALITSPAFLKRLDAKLPALRCRFILSAGGLLTPGTADHARDQLGVSPFEIYGSTETGAIAWRDTAVERHRWMPLPGVQIATDNEGRLSLASPFLPDSTPHQTDDQIELLPDGTFHLLGRLDRVLKIEEKRIALPDVEARLRALADIADAAVVPLQNNTRVFLGAGLVLTDTGRHRHATLGPGRFLLEIRRQLRPFLEPVAIPRQIRIVPRIPENTQGKRDTACLQQLFAPILPRELNIATTLPGAILELEIQPELLWFKGHFDRHPILPGITQLHWAIHYATTLLASGHTLRRVDVLKFQKPLLPGDRVSLTLIWEAERHRLTFVYRHGNDTASTGKIILGP